MPPVVDQSGIRFVTPEAAGVTPAPKVVASICRLANETMPGGAGAFR